MKTHIFLLLGIVLLCMARPTLAQDPEIYHAYQFSVDSMKTSDFQEIDSYVAENWVLHDPQFGNCKGQAGYIGWVSWWHTLLPDMRFVVDERLYVDDMVAIVWTLTGTHNGTMEGIPASGNAVQVRGMLIHHIVNGKLIESWITFNDQMLKLQLGLIDTLQAECERSRGISCD